MLYFCLPVGIAIVNITVDGNTVEQVENVVYLGIVHHLTLYLALRPRNQARRGYSGPSGFAVPRRHHPRSSP